MIDRLMPGRIRIGIAALAASATLSLLAAGPVGAAGSGSFTPTGDMNVPRMFLAAASLPDGRAMVFGGNHDGSATGGLAGTEFYDPASGAFTPGPSLGFVRDGPIAAPLADGRVLVAGGRGPLSSAQVYNPATNSFSGTGFMQDAREGAGAAPLPDGRVLVVGGYVSGTTYLETAEIWDPATNLWQSTGSMARKRYAPAVATLPDGRVLVVAGYGPGLHNDAEVYDPATGTFSSAGLDQVTLANGHRGAAAAPLPDGRVLIAGADRFTESLDLAEAFDPTTGDFNPDGIGRLTRPRGYAAAAPLGDGRVLVAGGYNAGGVQRSAEIFAATNTFSYSVRGRKLLVTVQAAGKVELAPAPVGVGKAAPAKKKSKPKPLLRPASGEGGPGTIEVSLLLTKAAKSKLKRTGKVKLSATISFKPVGGIPGAQTAKLKLRRPKKK
jgi:hypothetical protein